MMELPNVFRVEQNLPRPQVADIEREVSEQLQRLGLQNHVRPGQQVAITAGSRGIANIALIIRAIVSHFKQLGASPVIIPAMGSHGGGTAAGQQAILEGYGITEAYCGCPIRASMDTVIVCQAAEGFPVHFDRLAFEADHVFICGRIKPHTNFVGDIESGLMKMMLIGLGKHNGARIYHRAIKDYSFGQIVRSVAREVLAKCRVIAGLAIVENGYDETARLEAIPPAQLETREMELLKLARDWMPRIPFDQVDLLLIDEIGKNISGTGMDTNVVGRKTTPHRTTPSEFPQVRQIAVRSLTEATHGNAAGLGLAEFCRSRVLQQMDAQVTRINCLTGGHALGAMIPVDFESDREIIEAALPLIGLTEPPHARILWIRNTLDVVQMECSAAYWQIAQEMDNIRCLSEPRPLPFDSNGNLPDSATAW